MTSIFSNPNAVWGGAVLLGVLATCWRKLTTLVAAALSMVVVRAHVWDTDGKQATAMAIYLDRFPVYRFGLRHYGGAVARVRTSRRFQLVPYVLPTDYRCYWIAGRPVMAGVATMIGSGDLQLSLSYLRGTFDIEAALLASSDRLRDLVDGGEDHMGALRHCIRTLSGRWARTQEADGYAQPSSKDQGNQVGAQANAPQMRPTGSLHDPIGRHTLDLVGRTLDDIGPDHTEGVSSLGLLSLAPAVLAATADVRRWHDSREWYADRSIPWRHGLMLYGAPGNGKTSCVRAIAEDLDLPILSFDLASMRNDQFLDFWKYVKATAPCIALFEDLDAVFEGRENVTGVEGGLTFDCFLNALGGADVCDGILTVVTTNRPETVDPALASLERGATRPGRIESVVEVGPPDADGRRKIAARVLRDTPELIEGLVEDGRDDSGAMFLDRCRRTALALFWEGRGATTPSLPAPPVSSAWSSEDYLEMFEQVADEECAQG